MAKGSFGDKLKVMFSKEKGKSIAEYLYNEVLLPTAKNCVYNMGQIAWAKFCDMDVNSVPTINANGRTAYSKIGTTSSVRQPDQPSYLPATQHDHKDLSWIVFDNPHDCNRLINFMESKINSQLHECKVSDIYEFLDWNSMIVQTDFDIGWTSMQSIGMLRRNNQYTVQAPIAKRLPR